MQHSTMVSFSFVLMVLVTIQSSIAQSYDLAAGVRLGERIGVSVKMRVPPIDKNFTGEFIAATSFDGDEGLITLFGEQHMPIITRRLNIYAGIGAHVGWVAKDAVRDEDYLAPAGLSFIGGVELNFKRLNVSIDYKPVFNIKGGKKTFETSSALTLRYIVFKRNDIFTSPRKKRKKQRVKKRRKKEKRKSVSGKKGWQFWKKS